MEWARFKKDIKDKDGNIVFKANPKKYTKKTRYAIQLGDNEYIYVSDIPNDENCTSCARFGKDCCNTLFEIVEED